MRTIHRIPIPASDNVWSELHVIRYAEWHYFVQILINIRSGEKSTTVNCAEYWYSASKDFTWCRLLVKWRYVMKPTMTRTIFHNNSELFTLKRGTQWFYVTYVYQNVCEMQVSKRRPIQCAGCNVIVSLFKGWHNTRTFSYHAVNVRLLNAR